MENRRIRVEKEPPGDGKLRGSGHIGIADVTGQRPPAWYLDLAFETVNVCAPETDGEADSGVQQNIVVREIADTPREPGSRQAHVAEQAFSKARFVLISSRRAYGQEQRIAAQRSRRFGTREQQILERRSLEHAVIRCAQHKAEPRERPCGAKPWTDRAIFHQQTVAVPAQARAQRKASLVEDILDEGGLVAPLMFAGECEDCGGCGIEQWIPVDGVRR